MDGSIPMEEPILTVFTVRYYPDCVRDEALTIGLIAVSEGPQFGCLPFVRFTTNWQRVQALDPDADIELLSELESSIRALLIGAGAHALQEVEALNQSLSTSLRLKRCDPNPLLRIESGKATWIENDLESIEALARMYVR